MTRHLHADDDVEALRSAWGPEQGKSNAAPPPCFQSKSVEELMSLNVTEPSELIGGVLPTPGAVLIVGAKKSGKTVLGVQIGICIAAGEPYLWGQCKVNQHGPVLVIEQDDPSGDASLQLMVQKSGIPMTGRPFRWECPKDQVLGPEFLSTLESEIRQHGFRYVMIDSYTAIRQRRKAGGDIVKDEMEDFRFLDELAKRTNCTVAILHHISHGNSAKAWAERAGGTYGVGMAVEAQIFIDRYPELEINAPERLVRIEGRHISSSARVLRFREQTLDYEHVHDGQAATEWPHVLELKRHFGTKPFSPKSVFQETGTPMATVHRLISRLVAAGVVEKPAYGEYRLSREVA